MPFKKHCVCSQHSAWGSSETELIEERKVPKKVQDQILQISGKLRQSYGYSQYYCKDCIRKVSELYPDILVSLDGQSSAAQSSQIDKDDSDNIIAPPAKKQCTSGGVDVGCQSDSVIVVISSDTIQLDHLTVNDKCRLAHALAQSEASVIQNYLKTSFASKPRQVQSLLSLNVEDNIHSYNAVVTNFVRGLTNECSDTQKSDDRYRYQLCKTVESILNLGAFHAVLPIHFRESVLIYSVTGSSLAMKILGTGSHASYDHVKKWLNTLSSEVVPCPSGDVVVAFDNNQILQRRWRVRLDHKSHCHVVTTIASFEMTDAENKQSSVCPEPNWNRRKLSDTERDYVRYIDKNPHIKESHYRHMCPYLEQQLETAVNAQQATDGGFSDDIDEEVQFQRTTALYKTCYKCSFSEVPKTKLTCPQCKASLTKAKLKQMGVQVSETSIATPPGLSTLAKEFRVQVHCAGHEYKVGYKQQSSAPAEYSSYIDSGKEIEISRVSVQVPAFVNPCSYDAVAVVLRDIGQKFGIKKYGGDRMWLNVVCDGVPYNLATRLMKSMHTCSVCKDSINGLDLCAQHTKQYHPECEVSYDLEFDWVVLTPGSGHIEMNMVKAIVELGWEVFWKDMVMLFGFKSDAALQGAKKVTDHHKGWTLCRIAREALTKELMIPYARQELGKSHPDPSVEGFLKFVMNSTNATYAFMGDFTLELLDAIFMYRVGVRCNEMSFVDAGRAKFSKVWCGRNHPLYRELEACDTLTNLRMPPDIKVLANRSISISLSKNHGTGQGADFRLEEVNQRVQQWLPKVPEEKDWQSTCSNYDHLVALRKNIFSDMDITDPKDRYNKSLQNIDAEVNAFRTKLRATHYLLEPFRDGSLTSLSGTVLDKDLLNFCHQAREKRAAFIDAFLKNEEVASSNKATSVPFRHHPVYVTTEERESHLAVENQTVSTISSMITDVLEAIEDQDMKDTYESIWLVDIKHGKRTTKKDYLNFFYEICEYVNDESVYLDNPPSDNLDNDDDL